MHALLIAALAVCLQEDPKIFVQDGRAPAVYYGSSPLRDYYGNVRKGVWALRPDGALYFGGPRDSFEAFVARPLTPEEQKECGTYRIEGAKFHFTYRTGEPATGAVDFRPDGSIKQIRASGLDLYPLIHGVTFEFTGTWSSMSSFAGVSMRTSVHNSFSFFKGGLFVSETSSSTIGTAVEHRTSERRTGDAIIVETIRAEVLKTYGAEAKSRMGRFKIQGSALVLEYEDGRTESRFIGTVPGDTTGERFVLIGGTLYNGTPGKFPASSSAPAPAPAPAAPPAIRQPQYELQAPAGWTVREEDRDGSKIHFLLPPGVSKEEPFAIILVGSDLPDRTTRASNPDLPKALEEIVRGLAPGASVKRSGETAIVAFGGAEAVRVTFDVADAGRALRWEATCAIRDGRALITLALGSEAAAAKHGEEARATIALAKIAGAAPLERLSGDRFELHMPKGWKATVGESEGSKFTALVPPGADVSGAFGAFILTTPSGSHKAATDKAAVKELRGTLKQSVPGAEPQGEPETLRAAEGEPAVLLRYAARNGEGAVVHVLGYMVLKHGRAIVLIVAAQDKHVAEHGPALRAGFESLRIGK